MQSFLLEGGSPLRVLALGAHCDDIEIGAGGTLLTLVADRPDVAITAVVVTSTPERAVEARTALSALTAPVVPQVIIHEYPDARLPSHYDAVKDLLAELARASWDIVLCPHAHDAHQDHALLGSIVPTAFRDQLVFQYEIPKWDGDLGRLEPNIYVPLTPAKIARKWRVLDDHYVSQRHHDWWDEGTISALARLRGIECRVQFAEAFRVQKAVLGFTDPTTIPTELSTN